jgi:hypothetical protein
MDSWPTIARKGAVAKSFACTRIMAYVAMQAKFVIDRRRIPADRILSGPIRHGIGLNLLFIGRFVCARSQFGRKAVSSSHSFS